MMITLFKNVHNLRSAAIFLFFFSRMVLFICNNVSALTCQPLSFYLYFTLLSYDVTCNLFFYVRTYMYDLTNTYREHSFKTFHFRRDTYVPYNTCVTRLIAEQWSHVQLILRNSFFRSSIRTRYLAFQNTRENQSFASFFVPPLFPFVRLEIFWRYFVTSLYGISLFEKK